MILRSADQCGVVGIGGKHLNQPLQHHLQTVYPLDHQLLHLVHLLVLLLHQLVYVKSVALI